MNYPKSQEAGLRKICHALPEEMLPMFIDWLGKERHLSRAEGERRERARSKPMQFVQSKVAPTTPPYGSDRGPASPKSPAGKVGS